MFFKMLMELKDKFNHSEDNLEKDQHFLVESKIFQEMGKEAHLSRIDTHLKCGYFRQIKLIQKYGKIF